jgi:RNA polymerase sigma-70 factor (ECF subfamily)
MKKISVMPASTASTSPDEQRLTQIVQDHRTALLSYTIRLTGGDRGWAEDVLQETFLRAWRNLDRLTPDRGSVHGWLRRVAHNLVVDGYRMRRARPMETELTPEQGDIAPLPDHSETVLLSAVMSAALGRIWHPYRSTLVEIYLHDRTTTQAAAALGVPVGTVKSRAHHALRALRREAARIGLHTP